MSPPEKSAAKLPAARLDFKKAAQEILRDHPEAAGRLIIIDPETHERHGSLAARLRARTNGAFRKHLKEAFKKAQEKKGIIADVIRLGQVSAVVLTAGRETPQEALFDLHRQAGRLLVTRASDNIPYFQALFGTPYAASVAAADAYAAIRYLRQPDADPGFLRHLSRTRTVDFLRTGDPANLTSFVIDKIIADRDFSKMKIADLAGTAGIYVKGYAPSRAESDKLVEEFAPLKGKALDEEGLKTLAEIVKASKNPLVAKLAAHVLPEAAVVPAPAAQKTENAQATIKA